MRIDEFEFRNKQGEEIEPTKDQLVVYIKSLHKEIKTLNKALELACEMLCGVTVWDNELVFDDALKDCCEYFKTKAKEMMKSETTK